MRQLMRVKLVLVISCCLLGVPIAFAEVPRLIRYQGFLKDSQSVPLQGPYNLTFRLYPAVTGSTPVWTEAQTNVPIDSGSFSVLLGQTAILDAVDWSAPLWLSIQVNTDAELSPRQQITSVPLAIRAAVAEALATPVTTSNITDDANKLVPSGAIILWTAASCPAGYTRLSAIDNKFLVSAAAFNANAGGSNTHDHGGTTGSHVLAVSEIPPHSHGLRGHASAGGPGPNWFPNTADGVYTTTESAGGGAGHTHTIAPADSRPEFATVLLCQKN